MRNLVRNIFLCLSLAVIFTACNRPKAIPDKKLKEIFKEIFVVNSYIEGKGTFNPLKDSLDMYRPLLDKYGYKVEDLEYTMLSFAKRKSSKFSKLLDNVTDELEAEESDMRYRASMLDSINVWSQRHFLETIMQDSSIRVTTLKDTAKLRIAIPVKEGEYHIKYKYMIDSTDKNKGTRSVFNVKSSKDKKVETTSSWMSTRRRLDYKGKLDIKPNYDTLEIVFGGYQGEDVKKPSISIDSIKIEYMPTVEQALRDISKTFIERRITPVDIGYIRKDSLIRDYRYAPDSSTLYIYPVWIPEKWHNSR